MPEFLPEEFFNGKLEGWGVMESTISGLQKRATISAEGSWDPTSQTVTFTETYSFHDGHTDTLHWVIKKLARESMLALSLGLTAELRASRPDALITGGILGIRRRPTAGRATSISMTGSTE